MMLPPSDEDMIVVIRQFGSLDINSRREATFKRSKYDSVRHHGSVSALYDMILDWVWDEVDDIECNNEHT